MYNAIWWPVWQTCFDYIVNNNSALIIIVEPFDGMYKIKMLHRTLKTENNGKPQEATGLPGPSHKGAARRSVGNLAHPPQEELHLQISLP